MAFPQDRLPILAEMLINGTWTDVTSYVRLSDSIAIERGYQNEQGSLQPSTCNFKLNNRDGRFSNRNPSSPYFGLLPRNTQFRVGVTGSTTFLRLIGDESGISTTDKAVLDITGDIDIRIDVAPELWTEAMVLAAKFDSNSQRSWIFYTTRDGRLVYNWSTGGTSTTTAVSTVGVGSTTHRLALRVTHDVDNGASGNDVKFYTSDTISGTWTQLGSTVTTSGTTSIFNSTAPLTVGNYNDSSQTSIISTRFGTINVFSGWIYAFELYSGIAGTLRAKMDATSRTVGTTSWSDGLGTPNTWTLGGTSNTGFLTKTDYRFLGELGTLPQQWDTSGTDIYVPVTASGLTRRLTQGADPIESPLRRYISALSNVTGYWPGEDGSSSTSLEAVSGFAGTVTDASFSSDTTLPSSAGAVTMNSALSTAYARCAVTSAGSDAVFLFLWKITALPAADTVIMRVAGTGTIKLWAIVLAAGGSFKLNGYDSTGTATVAAGPFTFGTGVDPTTDWLAMELKLVTSGGNISYDLQWYAIDGDVGYHFGAATTAGTVGRFTDWWIPPSAGIAGFKFAHIVATKAQSIDVFSDGFKSPATAFDGETVGRRLGRLASEAGIDCIILGDPDATEVMGAQQIKTLIELFEDCASLDGGILYEATDALLYKYRTRNSLINQWGLTLDYSANDLSGELRPVEDDQLIRNDVTVSRPQGSSARSTVDTGPLSTQAPPNGVGRYKVAYELNAESDERLPFLAQYATFLGTWDELRYPQVQVNLERRNFTSSTTLTAWAQQTGIGDFVKITHLPSWLPPDDVQLLVRGISEVLENRGWKIVWNCSPYGPYRNNDLTSSSNSRYRAAAANCTLNASLTSTATSFVVNTAAGSKTWIKSASKPSSFPIDIVINGERMTVGAIGSVSGTSPQQQTFSSVTRSVNGVVKSHSAGSTVQVAEPFYLTRG